MIKGQRVLAISCGLEAVTGLALLVAPAVVARLVVGADIEGAGIIVANIAGIALISLAIAAWPRADGAGRAAYLAMLTYNLLVVLLLAETGATAAANGLLLWPVVGVHVILAVLLALASIGIRRAATHER